MYEQIEATINWLKTEAHKTYPIEGCVTGSALLGYFEKQDIDVFCYNEKSFNKLLFALHYSPMFTILDKVEQWKFNQYINKKDDSTFFKFGLITLKFTYNTCVTVNVILKKQAKDVFSVLSSFDMDIICKAYDFGTKQTLDLSGNSTKTKIADWNKWNTKYYSEDLWDMSRILRQLERCIKYYERGYDTDLVVKKYIEIIEKTEIYENIFSSENFDNRLNNLQTNIKVVKALCETWLTTHIFTTEQKQSLTEIIKNL